MSLKAIAIEGTTSVTEFTGFLTGIERMVAQIGVSALLN